MSALYTEVEERSIQYGAGITRVDNAENLLKRQNKKSKPTIQFFCRIVNVAIICVFVCVFWRDLMGNPQ